MFPSGGGKGEEGWFLSDPDHFRTPVVSRSIYYHLRSCKPPSPKVWCWRWAELSDSCRQEAETTEGNAFIYGAVKRGDLTRSSRQWRRSGSNWAKKGQEEKTTAASWSIPSVNLKILLLCGTAEGEHHLLAADQTKKNTNSTKTRMGCVDGPEPWCSWSCFLFKRAHVIIRPFSCPDAVTFWAWTRTFGSTQNLAGFVRCADTGSITAL